jgi:uncharacterized membrane protein YeaQ/YmgE (transglycosylase-associated protein family)
MAVLTWIIIGLVAGWIAHGLVGGKSGLPNNLVVGLVGAFLGGVLFPQFSTADRPGFFGSLGAAAVGAILFLLVWRVMRRRR